MAFSTQSYSTSFNTNYSSNSGYYYGSASATTTSIYDEFKKEAVREAAGYPKDCLRELLMGKYGTKE